MALNNKRFFLTALALFMTSNSSSVYAQNTPCSGAKGGIAHCEGATFVCNDGTVSASKKNCSQYFHGPSPHSASLSQVKPAKLTSHPYEALPQFESSTPSNKMKLDYPGFTVWLDCSKRGAVMFRYNAQRDSGNAKRSSSFFLDPKVPASCQQTSTKGYGNKYDRGHLVPANHLDSSPAAIRATNTMTNILPQAASMNRGAWLRTEEIVECYRDIDELLVIGGVIWGNNPSDDFFVKSHGVRTPDAFWKVIVRGSGQSERAIAWIVPNSQSAKKANLDQYLVTVDYIEKVTGETIPVADYAKHDKPSASWTIPYGCNKS